MYKRPASIMVRSTSMLKKYFVSLNKTPCRMSKTRRRHVAANANGYVWRRFKRVAQNMAGSIANAGRANIPHVENDSTAEGTTPNRVRSAREPRKESFLCVSTFHHSTDINRENNVKTPRATTRILSGTAVLIHATLQRNVTTVASRVRMPNISVVTPVIIENMAAIEMVGTSVANNRGVVMAQ